MDNCLACLTVELNMFLLGPGPRIEDPGWLLQILTHARHADLREETSADRLHLEDPLRQFADRRGILLASGKCLITGDKLQAAQAPNSKDLLALDLGHLLAHLPPPPHHHHPFPHRLIIYHRTHSTHFLSRLLLFNQDLGTLLM